MSTFIPVPYTHDPETNIALLKQQLQELCATDTDAIAIYANAAALLRQYLKRVNWVGFYRWSESRRELVLGPFQGLPACQRIPFGRGVCGRAVAERRTLCVPDVRAFPGHIACDAASRSELVIPLSARGRVWGVLDIDSPELNRFGADDVRVLEAFAAQVAEYVAAADPRTSEVP